MDIKKHKQEYDRIIRKYNLDDEKKAGQIADYLTKEGGPILAKEFADHFNMDHDDAQIFLSFIEKAISFRQKCSVRHG